MKLHKQILGDHHFLFREIDFQQIVLHNIDNTQSTWKTRTCLLRRHKSPQYSSLPKTPDVKITAKKHAVSFAWERWKRNNLCCFFVATKTTTMFDGVVWKKGGR